MKNKRVAVLVFMPIIIALTLAFFITLFNSDYWNELSIKEGLANALDEISAFIMVIAEIDIFISLLYFTSKKEKRTEIKTTANKLALIFSIYVVLINSIILALDLLRVPTSNFAVITGGILILGCVISCLGIIVSRSIHVFCAIYRLINIIRTKKHLQPINE